MRDEMAMDAALIIVPMMKQLPATPVVDVAHPSQSSDLKNQLLSIRGKLMVSFVAINH